MSDLRKGFTEDLRRFGLVLFGAGALTDDSATFRILAFAAGFILLMTAYIILSLKESTDDDDRT